MSKLVAGEAKDREALVLVILVELLETLELRGETTPGISRFTYLLAVFTISTTLLCSWLKSKDWPLGSSAFKS